MEGTGPGWQQEPLGWCSRPSHWPLVPSEIVQGAAGRPVNLGCVSMKRWGGDVVAGLCPCALMALRGCPVSEHESPTMNRHLLFPEQNPRRQQEGIPRPPPTRSPPSSPPRRRPHRCQGCRSWLSPPPQQPRCSPPSSSKIKMKICSVRCRMGPTPKDPTVQPKKASWCEVPSAPLAHSPPGTGPIHTREELGTQHRAVGFLADQPSFWVLSRPSSIIPDGCEPE